MFPEIRHAARERGACADEASIDDTRPGRSPIRIAAAFDQFEYRQVSPLFRRLAERFEYCVYGLNRVKTDLQTLREERYLLWKQNFPDLC